MVKNHTRRSTYESSRLSRREWSDQSGKNANALQVLTQRYQASNEPIPVSFREMVTPSKCNPRSLHFIHPYPGKLLHHIPYFFICNKSLSAPESVVADPFCGSGTVLLEALFSGRNTIGVDSNPLARLISKVKTTPIDTHCLREYAGDLLRDCRRTEPEAPPDVVNLTYWFHPHTIRQLSQIRRAIRKTNSPVYKDFFSMCFSATVRKVSLADPRVSVPVRLRENQYPKGHRLRDKTRVHMERLQTVDVVEVFGQVVDENLQRLGTPEIYAKWHTRARIVGVDARNLNAIQTNSIDLVVTSPPYMGAQKYIRSSSLELGWLGLAKSCDLRVLEQRCLGREHFRKMEYANVRETGIDSADKLIRMIFERNPLRACLAATYLNEMRRIFAELSTRIRSGGHLVLVCSNNSICGLEFRTQEFLRIILKDLFFRERLRLIDTIRSRGLMTKRNSTANIILHEWMLLFQKP